MNSIAPVWKPVPAPIVDFTSPPLQRPVKWINENVWIQEIISIYLFFASWRKLFTFQNGRRESMSGQWYCEPIRWSTVINLHFPISMLCTTNIEYRYSKHDTKLNNPDVNQQTAKHKATQTSEFTTCFTISNHAIFLVVALVWYRDMSTRILYAVHKYIRLLLKTAI